RQCPSSICCKLSGQRWSTNPSSLEECPNRSLCSTSHRCGPPPCGVNLSDKAKCSSSHIPQFSGERNPACAIKKNISSCSRSYVIHLLCIRQLLELHFSSPNLLELLDSRANNTFPNLPHGISVPGCSQNIKQFGKMCNSAIGCSHKKVVRVFGFLIQRYSLIHYLF